MAEETGDVGSKSGISKALSRKLGPLPGYAWVGLAVGGFLVYHKLKTGSFFGSGSSSSSAAVPAGTTDTTLGSTPGTLDTGGGGGGGSQGPSAGAGFYTDPNTALIEQELQQLLSMQPSQQQQTPNPNDNAPPQPSSTDVFGNPLSGGPIYAYSGGQLVGYAPHATSAFSTSTPASSGYEALGIAPSSPMTLLPTAPAPANTGPAIKTPVSGSPIVQ